MFTANDLIHISCPLKFFHPKQTLIYIVYKIAIGNANIICKHAHINRSPVLVVMPLSNV